MAYDLEEQEQIDQLKAFWGSYGTAVLTFLVVLLVLVGGWRGWQWYQGHQANQARGYFEALEDASRQTGDESVARINAAVTTLRAEYGATDYAVRGALVAAAALQARGDLAAAQSQLEWISRSGPPALAPVARLRLAGLFYDGPPRRYSLCAGQAFRGTRRMATGHYGAGLYEPARPGNQTQT